MQRHAQLFWNSGGGRSMSVLTILRLRFDKKNWLVSILYFYNPVVFRKLLAAASRRSGTMCIVRRGYSCVWHRGPRPAKGRSSRLRRASSPAAGSAAAAAAASLLLRTTDTSTTTMTTCSTVGTTGSTSVAPGYEQYQKSLLEVPWPHAEYGEASSDDLSSEWDSDVPEPPPNSKVNNYTVLILAIYYTCGCKIIIFFGELQADQSLGIMMPYAIW